MSSAAKRIGKTISLRPVALLSAALIAAAAGCGPQPSLESEAVQATTLTDAVKCRHLGTAKVSAGRDFLPGDKDERIKEELLTKARELAVEVGADTVAASGEITDGAQNFRLYICNVQP